MKRILVFTVILTLIFIAAACKGKTEKPDEDIVVTDQSRETVEIDSGQKEPVEEKPEATQEKSPEKEKTIGEEIEKTEPMISPAVPETKKPDLGPDEEGIITFIEGDVDIIRNNESLGDEVEEGFGIQNYDVVTTGDASITEIEVLSESCPETFLTISENTIFSFEINKLDNTDTTTLDLMGGALALKVGAMANDQDLEVTTGEVNMGVRGTTFSVSALPTGDTLITCKKGLVECTDNSGEKKRAKPGKVVEKSGGGE